MTQERDKQIATTILDQFGPLFRPMINAKDAVAIEDGVQFGFMKGNQGINKVQIVLNARDTYDMKFWRIGRTKATEITAAGDIYNDQLNHIFEDITGLATRMTP